MIIKENDEIEVNIYHNADVPGQVYNKVLKFFTDHDLYNGECVMQTDRGITESPEFLAELADFLEFNVIDKWII